MSSLDSMSEIYLNEALFDSPWICGVNWLYHYFLYPPRILLLSSFPGRAWTHKVVRSWVRNIWLSNHDFLVSQCKTANYTDIDSLSFNIINLERRKAPIGH